MTVFDSHIFLAFLGKVGDNIEQEAPMASQKCEQIISMLKKYFKNKPEVTVAYLFGSRARDESNPLSDTDIAVLINKGIAKEGILGYQAELTADLMAVLKSNRIDVICLNSAPPLLAHRVVRDGTIIDSKDEKDRIFFEVHSLQRYIDTKPLREIQNKYFRQRVLA